MNNEPASLKELVANLCNEPLKNLEMVSNYLTVETGCKCGIIVDDPEHLNPCNCTAEPTFSNGVCVMSISHLPTDLKAKSFAVEETPAVLNQDRRIYSGNIKNVNGYICRLDRSSIFAYSDECEKICGLAANLIEMYRMECIASRDKLTGALNRKYLDIQLDNHFAKAAKMRKKFSILMADLNNFKSVNDKYGHVRGDEIIRHVSGIIRTFVGRDDVYGRYGGDEFLILLKGADSQSALERAVNICSSVYEAMKKGETLGVTVSIGIASCPNHATSKQILIDYADSALYFAKKGIKDPGLRCMVWSDFISVANGRMTGNEFLSGDAVTDLSKFRALFDILKLVRLPLDKKSKLYMALTTVANALDAATASVMEIKNGAVRELCSAATSSGFVAERNLSIITESINKKSDVCMVDWETKTLNVHTGLPDWQSVICSPIVAYGDVKGVLYVTSPLREKEFSADDKKFLHNLAISLAMFM